MTDEQLKAVNAAFNKHEIYTMDQLKQVVKNRGSHFFDKSSMSFFNSRVNNRLFAAPSATKILFVTSERCDWADGTNQPHSRGYSVRCYDIADGSIDTLGEFQQYKTLATALKHAEDLSLTM